MSHSIPAPPANGHAANGRHRVDRAGYPALFQRVAPTAQVSETVETPAEPAPVIGRAGGVREAFLGFCQAALFSPGAAPHGDRPSESAAAVRALAAAEAFGFTRDEVRRLGCGLYTGPAAVRDDLRGVGFVAAEIDAARLVCDESGRPRSELTGCLVVPLTDETGHLCDFLLLTVGEAGAGFTGYRFLYGPAKSKVVAYGLQVALSRPAGRESLVLVDDVLECLLLQCRGVPHVAAVGATGQDFSPRRWEELARLGVATVTLAFRRDDRHAAGVRDILVNALRARTAPQVFVANPYPGGERGAADVLRRFGRDTCAVALAARSLAFHDKDFGADDYARSSVEPPRVYSPAVSEQVTPPAVPSEPHHRAAFRRHIAELAAALPAEDGAIAGQVIAAVEAAIAVGDFARAAWLIDGDGYPHGSSFPYAYGWGTLFQTPWPQQVMGIHQSASVASSGAVLDRLTKSPQPAEIPSHLAGFAGRDTSSAVEWIIDPSPRGRLASLCERLIDACERRSDAAFVVACSEHTARQVVLTLATRLAARLADGPGLTVEEVRSRLAGSEPAGGYRDKPWLADEAADRLRRWSSRLTFVTCPATPAGRAAVEQAVETARAKAPIGGVFFDALPASWSGMSDPCGAGWLNELANRYGGTVIAASPSAPVAWPMTAWPTPFGIPTRWSLPQTEGGRAILSALRDWLRRESDMPRV